MRHRFFRPLATTPGSPHGAGKDPFARQPPAHCRPAGQRGGRPGHPRGPDWRHENQAHGSTPSLRKSPSIAGIGGTKTKQTAARPSGLFANFRFREAALSAGSLRGPRHPEFGDARLAASATQHPFGFAAWPVPGNRLRGGAAGPCTASLAQEATRNLLHAVWRRGWLGIRSLPAPPMRAPAGDRRNARAGSSGGNFCPAG